MLQRTLASFASMATMTAALAQTALPPAAPVDFPADAQPLTAEALDRWIEAASQDSLV